MGTVKNVEMNYFNGVDYDLLIPYTGEKNTILKLTKLGEAHLEITNSSETVINDINMSNYSSAYVFLKFECSDGGVCTIQLGNFPMFVLYTVPNTFGSLGRFISFGGISGFYQNIYSPDLGITCNRTGSEIYVSNEITNTLYDVDQTVINLSNSTFLRNTNFNLKIDISNASFPGAYKFDLIIYGITLIDS